MKRPCREQLLRPGASRMRPSIDWSRHRLASYTLDVPRRHLVAAFRVLVPSIALIASIVSTGCTNQNAARDAVLRAHHIDPASPLVSRVGDPPDSAIAMITNAGMGTPTAHALSADERAILGRAFDALPPLHKRVLAERLRTVSALDGMPNNALTSSVTTNEPWRVFDITLRAGLFHENMSQFLTQKERTIFDSRNSTMSVAIDGGTLESLVFILLHESTHIVDGSRHMTPGTWVDGGTTEAPITSGFTLGIWSDRVSVAPAHAQPILDRIVFRNGGGPLPIAQAPDVYAALSRTPFASLYGSSSAPDDLAEFVAWYHLTQKLGQPYRISVRDGEKDVFAYEPMASPLVRKRFDAMRVFYE